MRLTRDWLLLVICLILIKCIECKRDKAKLLRKKRYIAFPEGAAFSAVYCMTSQMGITDGASIFSEGINWGFVYDLPNDTRPLLDNYGAAQKRRNRRDLYSKVENILTSMGYNGRTCILRSLCEASRNFKTREDSLLHHILGLIFRFPKEPIHSHEPEEHKLYHWASQIGSTSLLTDDDDEKCSEIFPCHFSLIDMALGHYSGSNSMLNNDINNDYAY